MTEQSSINKMETYFGYVQTVNDALRLFEAVTSGILPSATRRLSGAERKLIKSGSVFIFDETNSSIQRWTDGLKWSSSRIDGHFLLYHQKVANPIKSSLSHHRPYSNSSYHRPAPPLIKRTLSVVTSDQRKLVLISYYADSDVDNNLLKFPSQELVLRHIEVPQDSYFRMTTHMANHRHSFHPYPHYNNQSRATTTTDVNYMLTPLTGKESNFPRLRLAHKVSQANSALYHNLPSHPKPVASHVNSSLRNPPRRPMWLQNHHSNSNDKQGGSHITSLASLVPPPPTGVERSGAYIYQLPHSQYNNKNNRYMANPGHLLKNSSVSPQLLTTYLPSNASSYTSSSSSYSSFCSSKLSISPSPEFVSANHHYRHYPQQTGYPFQLTFDSTNSNPPAPKFQVDPTPPITTSSVNRAYLHKEDQRQLSSFTFTL